MSSFFTVQAAVAVAAAAAPPRLPHALLQTHPRSCPLMMMERSIGDDDVRAAAHKISHRRLIIDDGVHQDQLKLKCVVFGFCFGGLSDSAVVYTGDLLLSPLFPENPLKLKEA